MKPYLIIEGKSHEIEIMQFIDGKPLNTLVNKDGKKVIYWNDDIGPTENSINLDSAIYWKGRYEPVYDVVQKIVTSYTEDLQKIHNELTEIYLEEIKHRIVGALNVPKNEG